jgi:hypothetical protein
MRVEFRITNPLTCQSGKEFFSPLTDPFYVCGQFFSVLVSEKAGLLTSLASVLENLSTPLLTSHICEMKMHMMIQEQKGIAYYMSGKFHS